MPLVIRRKREGLGMGEWGEWGDGGWGMGEGEWGMGNGEWGMGNGEWGWGWSVGRIGTGKEGEWCLLSIESDSQVR